MYTKVARYELLKKAPELVQGCTAFTVRHLPADWRKSVYPILGSNDR